MYIAKERWDRHWLIQHLPGAISLTTPQSSNTCRSSSCVHETGCAVTVLRMRYKRAVVAQPTRSINRSTIKDCISLLDFARNLPVQHSNMRLSLALWTLLLSVSVLADFGKDRTDKGDDDHHFPGRNRRHKSNHLKARTHSGSFTGFIDPEVPDVAQWLGIPYGAPPTGDQRFLPPKPAAHAGDIATTEYKPICMQAGGRPADLASGGVFWALVPEFQNQDPQSEDCLYLNIWGPRKSIGKGRRPKHLKKVPVIIWSEHITVRLPSLLHRADFGCNC
jgi:hypothetical protein